MTSKSAALEATLAPGRTLSDVYARQPLRFHGKIPIFSEADRYIENYERIAHDHLSALQGLIPNTFNPDYFVHQMEYTTATLLRKYVRPDSVVLDVGIGRGNLLAYFPDVQRFGMDISLSYLELAQARDIEVCYARIEDMPYKEATFDIVVCTDVLEHVLDLNFCCRKMLSVLKPEGVLIARVPFQEDLSWYAAPECPYQYVHLRTFDLPSVQMLFEKVFECKVIEMMLAGYFPDERRRKPRVPFPNLDYVLARLQTTPEADRPFVYETILQHWFEAVVVNAVVTKSSTTAPAAAVEWIDLSRSPVVTESRLEDAITLEALERQLIAELHHHSQLAAHLETTGRQLTTLQSELSQVQSALSQTKTLLAGKEAELAATQAAFDAAQNQLQEAHSTSWWRRLPRRSLLTAITAGAVAVVLLSAFTALITGWMLWSLLHLR